MQYVIIPISPHGASQSPVVDTVVPVLPVRTLKLREWSDLLKIQKLEGAEWPGP